MKTDYEGYPIDEPIKTLSPVLHPSKQGPFNDSERQTIINALNIAADKYRQDAKIEGVFGTRLADQFEYQAETIERWSDLFDTCESITIK